MIYLKLLTFLLVHKWYVFVAGLKLKVPIWRLVLHDWSKFGTTEFFNYARYKYLNGHRREWATGWVHHLHNNPHHPEHWIILWHGNPEFYSAIGESIAPYVSVLPIPEVFVREMLADMHAASKQVTGSWDISAWLNENGPKIYFHHDTITLINKAMVEIDYILENEDWTWKMREESIWP